VVFFCVRVLEYQCFYAFANKNAENTKTFARTYISRNTICSCARVCIRCRQCWHGTGSCT